MKKALILSSVLMALLFCSSQALAINNEDTGAGKSISLQAGALNLNFSPGVFGEYITEDTSGNEQWFAIGTYHGGGTLFYATAQQQTTVWKKERGTTQTFSDAAIGTTEAATNSAADWEDGGWKSN